METILVDRFQSLSRERFNGKLHVKSNRGHQWILYFFQGNLIWGTGGSHPARRWRRHLLQDCRDIPYSAALSETDDMESGQYQDLRILVKRQQLAQKQVVAICENTLAEVLFDIIQESSVQQLSYTSHQQNVLELPLTIIASEAALKPPIAAWQSWQDAGLAGYSPNLAPVLQQPEQLRQLTPPAVYQNFVTLLTGSQTLRDLAVQMKQDLLLLTRSLIPYIRPGIIKLISVPDLLPPTPQKQAGYSTATNKATPTPPQTKQEPNPLVACVDDSIQTCQMMEQIFTAEGFRFISIQNPLEALTALVAQKPDLIFLDLMMPAINGYEICAKLRRVSAFANTPIIILTGSDGLVDRVRANQVGATDFFTKPIDAQKVLAVPHKYLSFSLLSRLAKSK